MWIFPNRRRNYKLSKLTGKEINHLNIVREYSKKQTLWADENYAPDYADKILLDLSAVEPTVAGPKRPQDKILLKKYQ